MAQTRSARAKKFAEWDEKPVKGIIYIYCSLVNKKPRRERMLMLIKIADFDPEADGAAAEEESDSEEDEDAEGTEHYVSVGYVPLNPTDNFLATVY